MTRGTDVTRDEFERAYAERSGVTVQELHDHGRFAEPCDCGADMCEGWQMAHRASVLYPKPE